MPRWSLVLPFSNALRVPIHQVYDDASGLYAHAESLGFDTVFAVEHHFTDYVPCPDPMLINAFAAGRTSRLRLGSALSVPVWQDPLRLAEQIGMLDLLSRGRLIVGLGLGIAIHEHRGFGVDPSTLRRRFVEAVTVLRLALDGDAFSFAGEFYRYDNARVVPAPLNDVSLLGAVINPADGALMGSLGLGFLTDNNGQPLEDTTRRLDDWGRAVSEVGGDPGALERIFNAQLWIADTDEQAVEEVLTVLPRQFAAQAEHYEMAENPYEGIPGWEYEADAARRFAAMDSSEQALRAWCTRQFVGSPATVAERIRVVVASGFDHIGFFSNWAGTVTAEHQKACWRRFMHEVAPLVPAR